MTDQFFTAPQAPFAKRTGQVCGYTLRIQLQRTAQMGSDLAGEDHMSTFCLFQTKVHRFINGKFTERLHK